MSNTVPRLSIHLLGAPDVQVAGSLLTLNNQKVRALLYYLAATGQPHTRDHLATLLWSESSEQRRPPLTPIGSLSSAPGLARERRGRRLGH